MISSARIRRDWVARGWPVAGMVGFALFLGCVGEDAPTRDAGADVARCSSDEHCADRFYCNGVERCMPGAASADARGCIFGEPPCAIACDEATASCLTMCDVDSDVDEDGHLALQCGGDDCDDTDPDRFPGNEEVCDPERHDEDCDPTTYGALDRDEDGFPDDRCCNLDQDGDPVCGTDCNDRLAEVYPGGVESCDRVDNDCDGVVDEDTGPGEYFPDCDGDSFGAVGSAGIAVCAPPVERPAACGPADVSATWSPTPTDCDDGDPAIHPDAAEVCDGIDNDCDGSFDRTSEDVDGDGFATTACGGDDCDDTNASVNPAATEVCNGLDDDCALGVDDEPASLTECAPGEGCAAGRCFGPPAGLAAGSETSCTWDGDAALCWGHNDGGRLGIGAAVEQLIPAHVPGLSGVEEVAAGASHTCFRIAGGSVMCVGENLHGQIGDGTMGSGEGRPSPVMVMGLSDAQQVVARGLYSCARLGDGTVRCWGDNASATLGDGTTVDRPAPVPVAGLSGVVQVAAGGQHTCARLDTGEVRCWGGNTEGQLGTGTTDALVLGPTAIPGLDDAVDVATGAFFTCVARATGVVECAGRNADGQLGDASTSQRTSLVRAAGLVDVVALSAGSAHVCAIRSTGTLACWGDNAHGQLGIGSTLDSRTPQSLRGLAGLEAVAAGGDHTCTLAGSDVWCWGRNTMGQVGDGTKDMDRTGPVRVTGL